MPSNYGTNVFILGLSPRAKEFGVERFLKAFDIRYIIVKQGKGFVKFEDATDANNAVYEVNN